MQVLEPDRKSLRTNLQVSSEPPDCYVVERINPVLLKVLLDEMLWHKQFSSEFICFDLVGVDAF